MGISDRSTSRPILLLVAGAKGAVGSTLAVAIATMKHRPEYVLSSLTTRNMFPYLAAPDTTQMAGWDTGGKSLTACIEAQGVIPEHLWKPHAIDLNEIPLHVAPSSSQDLRLQIEQVMKDIQTFKTRHPDAQPVFINLLPAGVRNNLRGCQHISELFDKYTLEDFPDIPYMLAAIRSEVPVVNFTPNELEIPAMVSEAVKYGIPLSGRDGKTGQTFFKVVLASAFKARNFFVDGWYSLNILGNADGMNLMNPEKAAGKLANKTELLDEILGYQVGQKYGVSSHKVHIDYYPPRGDAKEAWDVIDFSGMFGLPMSIRMNFQGRDSILAAPLVLDLARWMAALKMAGKSGPIPELGFYFKKPVGENPPLTFQDQIQSLRKLEQACNAEISSTS
jgi:myo-inositol-1-phosphate synthase